MTGIRIITQVKQVRDKVNKQTLLREGEFVRLKGFSSVAKNKITSSNEGNEKTDATI